MCVFGTCWSVVLRVCGCLAITRFQWYFLILHLFWGENMKILPLYFSITENGHLVQDNNRWCIKNGFCKEPVTFSFCDLCCHPYLSFWTHTRASLSEQLIAMSFVTSKSKIWSLNWWQIPGGKGKGNLFLLPRQSAKSPSRSLPWNSLFFLPLPQVFLHIACFIAKLITPCAYKTDKNLQKRIQRKTKPLCFTSWCTFATNT